jgi:hypothetical protein
VKQFTITYRTAKGWLRFAFVDAGSKADARGKIETLSPGAVILTMRENNPPLETVTEVRS